MMAGAWKQHWYMLWDEEALGEGGETLAPTRRQQSLPQQQKQVVGLAPSGRQLESAISQLHASQRTRPRVKCL